MDLYALQNATVPGQGFGDCPLPGRSPGGIALWILKVCWLFRQIITISNYIGVLASQIDPWQIRKRIPKALVADWPGRSAPANPRFKCCGEGHRTQFDGNSLLLLACRSFFTFGDVVDDVWLELSLKWVGIAGEWPVDWNSQNGGWNRSGSQACCSPSKISKSRKHICLPAK